LNWQHRQKRQYKRGAGHREHVSEIRTGAAPASLGHQIYPQLHACARIVSSIFDFLTLVCCCGFVPAGWFMESLATQVLVIFVIPTRGSPLRSRPNPLLAGTSLTVAAVGILLPYTAIGRWFGFVPLPLTFLAALGAMVVCYLVLAESVKRWFYRRFPPHGVIRSPILRSQFPLIGT
jgi:hypothetical protein